MAADIISQIVEKRKSDIAQKGFSFGHEIPKERSRLLHPFLDEKGVILEVKRASPSKGDIAPGLDASATASVYEKAGAGAISVLTEENFFKGSLDDLKSVCDSVDCAVLRKDFLIYPEEIEIAYKCGADAVLLIARILEKESLAKMLSKCAALGMTAFVELRLESDLQRLSSALKEAKGVKIVCGVNSRDLKDFSIDLLSPCVFLPKIKAALGDVPVVFESGIRTSDAAGFAGSLGFEGLLLGEAAARNSLVAKDLVAAFQKAAPSKSAAFWKNYSEKLAGKSAEKKSPFVKICGLTNFEDAEAAIKCGADFLGFIFCASSPRKADGSLVRRVRSELSAELSANRIFMVGVITEISSAEGQTAIALLREGVLDALQLHGEKAQKEFFADEKNRTLPHYCAVNLCDESDIEKIKTLFDMGEPRVLIDAKSGERIGGTGKRIVESLVHEAGRIIPLWLAGGLGAENIREVIVDCRPELVDASSLLESAPGKKDHDKLRHFFSETCGAV